MHSYNKLINVLFRRYEFLRYGNIILYLEFEQEENCVKKNEFMIKKDGTYSIELIKNENGLYKSYYLEKLSLSDSKKVLCDILENDDKYFTGVYTVQYNCRNKVTIYPLLSIYELSNANIVDYKRINLHEIYNKNNEL